MSEALGVDVTSAMSSEIAVGGGCSYTDADGQPVFTIPAVTDADEAAQGFDDSPPTKLRGRTDLKVR